ncbi:hypothetical protein FS935_19775 [Metabacillus litoralis]|uniref:Uncharacterized protein n=1 Tax=Metabacillus litoralis TaxID=152268 RepID=A0A5C6VK23_9BACI|nr:hypothetical protein FS935_19775 [Metabacillus litoralis]
MIKLRKTFKYSTIFIWAVAFLYYLDIFMPKNIWYLVLGFLGLFFSYLLINKIFDSIPYKQKG